MGSNTAPSFFSDGFIGTLFLILMSLGITQFLLSALLHNDFFTRWANDAMYKVAKVR